MSAVFTLAGCGPSGVVKSVGKAVGEVAPVTCWTGQPGSEYVVDWVVLSQAAPAIGEPWRC